MQTPVAYEEATSRKFPEQIAIVVAKDAKGEYNPVTVGWIMPVSMDPPMWAFSLAPVRHSLEAIRLSKEFVISFPSEAMAADATFHGTHSGRQIAKLKEFGTKTQPATEIDCVLLADAVGNLECVLESEHAMGDCITVVGRVVASHMNEDLAVRRVYALNPELDLGGVALR
jgi:flavin reductase (DIM6/NTAB) family NADH-FMN oxidoreductase RutF